MTTQILQLDRPLRQECYCTCKYVMPPSADRQGQKAKAKTRQPTISFSIPFFDLPFSLLPFDPIRIPECKGERRRCKPQAQPPPKHRKPARIPLSPQYQQRKLNSSIASLLFASQLQNNAIQCALLRLTRLIPPKPCPLRHMRGPARCEALAEVLTGSQATFSCGWLISLA